MNPEMIADVPFAVALPSRVIVLVPTFTETIRVGVGRQVGAYTAIPWLN